MDRKTFLKTGLSITAGLPFAWQFFNRNSPNTFFQRNDLDIWVKTGGPIGGLGYNVRYRFDDPKTMFVTDAWSGLQKTSDGGANWTDANHGITFRDGPSEDAIPVFAFKIDPNDNNIMWAGMEFGGGLYKSTNGGQNWSKKDHGIELDPNPDAGPLTIRHIEIEPGNSNVVYVMGERHTGEWGNEFERVKGFVYRSTDGGENFSLLQEFNSLTRWMFIHPSNTNHILLTTGIFDREANTDDLEENYASGNGLGMYLSKDGGDNWSQVNSGINPNNSMFIGGADRDPSQPNTVIIAAGNNNDHNKGKYGALYRSVDFGTSWEEVTPDLSYNPEPFTAVAFAPSNPNIVYAGSAQAIYRSEDNGISWSRFGGQNGAPYGPPGVRSGVPIDMVVDSEDSDIVFVNNYGGGVFKSEDGGQSWISWSKGYSGADIHSIAVNPQNPEQILANGRSGIFKSDDAGNNWKGISYGHAAFPEGLGTAFDPSDESGNTLLCTDEHEGFLLRSVDGGQNWHPALYLETGAVGNRHGARNIVFAPSNPQVVYAGFMAAGFHANPHELDFAESKGMYRSEDGGQNWVEANSGLPSGARAKNVSDITVSYQNPDLVYISLRDGGVYKTTDGGENWQNAKGILPDGESWEDIWRQDDPIPRHALMSIAVHPEDDQVVYIGGNIFGVYRSEDGGENWAQVLSPQFLIDHGTADHGHITSIAIDPLAPSNIYAGEWHGGVYHSTDNGDSWTLLNEELSTRAIAMLKFSGEGEFLYAATQGQGVFRYQLRELTATNNELTLDVPQEIQLQQNYPNPFNPSTTINYSISNPGQVSLSIFTVAGQRVTTLIDRPHRAGSHTVTFDATDLSSGVYLYRLKTNGSEITKKLTILK